MAESCYILFFTGIVSLIIGLWLWKKSKEQMQSMEKRLKEKESALYELYKALEEIIQFISEDHQKKEQERQNIRDIQEPIPKKNNTKSNQVMDLKNKGYSEEQIARELKIGKGEVKIILDLKE